MARLLNNWAGAHAAYEEFDFKFRRQQSGYSPKLERSRPIQPCWTPGAIFALLGELWLEAKSAVMRAIDMEYEG